VLKHLANYYYEETAMKSVLGVLAIFGMVLGTEAAAAKEQVIILSVENMTCSVCPVTVRKALEMQEGVSEANVSLEPPHAVVTFDDEHTDVQTLVATTTNAGFPSALLPEGGATHE
jgi:periplasmic mercuric ion binding protein